MLGLSTYTFAYAEGLSYLSNDPKACVNCHIMREQYDGWQKTTHHAVATCNDCHVPENFVGKYWTKGEHGFRHSKGFTFQDFHEPIQMTACSRDVVNENCVRCPQGTVHDITAQDAAVGRLDCTRCHTGIGHGAAR